MDMKKKNYALLRKIRSIKKQTNLPWIEILVKVSEINGISYDIWKKLLPGDIKNQLFVEGIDKKIIKITEDKTILEDFFGTD